MSALEETCVVVPTRNEADNISRLCATLKSLSPKLRVIVVDDASPDGTADAAENAGARVLRRAGRRGRGSAVLEGFREALTDPAVKFLVEMDADFSHEPKELPALVDAVASGRADMVVGSRYHPDSRIVGWPLSRRIFSKSANLLARPLLHLGLSDCTNGYRAYTRAAVEALDPDALGTTGFFVLSETACQLRAKGFRLAERPSVFVDRVRGSSNLTVREVLSALGGLVRLAFKS